MKQVYLNGIIICLLCIVLCTNCGPNKLEQLKNKIKDTSIIMNKEFLKAFNSAETIINKIKDLYKKQSSADISITGMDESEGGEYHVFAGDMYVPKYKENDDKAITFSMGAKPLTDDIKKEMLMLLKIGPDIKNLVKNNKYFARSGFTSIRSVLITYPNVDVTSILPPGLDFNILPFFKYALNEGKNKIYWNKPEVTVGPEGWVQSVQSGLYNESDPLGVYAIDIPLYEIGLDFIKDSENILLFVYEDTTVMAASSIASKELEVKVLQDFDYMTQLQTNPQLSTELRLSDKKQEKGFKDIAKLMTENSEIGEVVIQDQKYNVIIQKLDDINYYIIGLI